MLLYQKEHTLKIIFYTRYPSCSKTSYSKGLKNVSEKELKGVNFKIKKKGVLAISVINLKLHTTEHTTERQLNKN